MGRQLWIRDAVGMETTDGGHAGRVNPIRYRGYYYDEETGMFLVSSCYYDPETGRFISPVSVEYLDPEIIGGITSAVAGNGFWFYVWCYCRRYNRCN